MPRNALNDWTIIKILSWTESYFNRHAIDSPRLTAEMLLAHSLGIERLDLYLQHDRPLQKNELSDFKQLIKRRKQKEPVAYIIKEKGFFESDFEVSHHVLIPRPDTETIVEAALKVLAPGPGAFEPKTVLDLGTGSGAIIVSMAKALPDHFYVAGDVSRRALAVAKRNARKIARDRICFFAGSWCSALKPDQQFDLIVSNPPYIPKKDIQTLQPEVKEFEPLLALDGGDDGLGCFRSILSEAHHYLAPGGTLLLEMGFDQKEGMLDILRLYSQYSDHEFIRDMAGHNRVVLIKKIN